MGKEMLLEIYNKIFSAGTCPKSWREIKVVSILKPVKEPNNVNSYRPISLLPCVRKLFEKMICTRLDYWAEKFEILSPSQFGFRKGRETRDCLSLLSSVIRISFEQKKKTLTAFLDIFGAYDNVLIDVLCGNLCGLQLPLEMVCILWDLLHPRSLIFYHGGEAYTRHVGVKGLSQGSVLSPFLYNVCGSEIEAQMVRGVSLLQYADDLVIYASGFIVQQTRESMQKSLGAVSVFFNPIWAFP
jgi:hypothetical protein